MKFNSSFDHSLKIILLGDAGVGKTNFIHKYVSGKFSERYATTLGIDCKSKICTLPNSKKKVKVNLWDTAGQERYMSINKLFFQRVQGIILMYDITSRSSYEQLSKWVQIIKKETYKTPVILVGNKLDQEDDKRIVREKEGLQFAKDNDFLFRETSAFNGQNINNVINDLCEKIVKLLEVESGMIFNEFDLITVSKMAKKDEEAGSKCC